jgi:1-phosphofructokinase
LELGELVGEVLDPTDTPALVKAAQALQKEGAQNVLVSLASHGALLVSREGEVYRQSPAPGEVQNSVGAGDSMVAGFLAGLERGYDLPHALRLGAAAGGATAFSPRLATQREIHAVYQQMKEEG